MEQESDAGVVPEGASESINIAIDSSQNVPVSVAVDYHAPSTSNQIGITDQDVPSTISLDQNNEVGEINDDSQGGDSNGDGDSNGATEAGGDDTSQDSQEEQETNNPPSVELMENNDNANNGPRESVVVVNNSSASAIFGRQDSVEGPSGLNVNPFAVEENVSGHQDAEVPNLGQDVDDNSQMSEVAVADFRPAPGGDIDNNESQLSSQVQHVETQVQQSSGAVQTSSSPPSTEQDPQPGPSHSRGTTTTGGSSRTDGFSFTRGLSLKRKERPQQARTSDEIDSIVEETRSKKHKSSDKAKKLLQKLLAGTPVKSHVRRTGNYLIGPKLGISPVKCIEHCLGRRDGMDRYYLLKILHLGIGTKETQVKYLFLCESLSYTNNILYKKIF